MFPRSIKRTRFPAEVNFIFVRIYFCLADTIASEMISGLGNTRDETGAENELIKVGPRIIQEGISLCF